MKEENFKKNGRGGRREGAGRPKGNRRLFSFRIEERLADFIDSHENRTEFIHNCIENAFSRQEEDNIFPSQQTLGDIYSAMNVRQCKLCSRFSFDIRYRRTSPKYRYSSHALSKS